MPEKICLKKVQDTVLGRLVSPWHVHACRHRRTTTTEHTGDSRIIHLVTAENEHFYKDEMQQARRLDSRRDHGMLCAGPEHDEPPAEKCHNAVHMLYIVSGKVLGYQRLLPMMRPQFRSDVIPQLWLSEPDTGDHIWEMSCHCIAPAAPSSPRSTGAIAYALGVALIQWGIEHGVTQIVTAIDPADIVPLTELLFRPNSPRFTGAHPWPGDHRGDPRVRSTNIGAHPWDAPNENTSFDEPQLLLVPSVLPVGRPGLTPLTARRRFRRFGASGDGTHLDQAFIRDCPCYFAGMSTLPTLRVQTPITQFPARTRPRPRSATPATGERAGVQSLSRLA